MKSLAEKLASLIDSGAVILISGDLGAGKTTFARAIIQACCGEETAVASPTFMLTQSYTCSRFIVHHYDLYRIKHPAELMELGIEEQIGQGVLLVEWPEMAGEFDFGKAWLQVNITHATTDTRSLKFSASDAMLPVLQQIKGFS